MFPCPHCGLQMELSITKPDISPPEIPAEQIPALRLQKRATVSLKSPRVTLTKAQYASPAGQALINLLVEIGGDGIVTEEEVRRLQRWLADNADSDIPAVGFLLRLSQQVLLDSKVTQDEAFEIQVAIERVLPKDIRQGITKKRWEASRHLPASAAMLANVREFGGNPPPGITNAEAYALMEVLRNQPSESQVQYIRALGGNPHPGMTRDEASHLIEQLLSSIKATERQLDFIRDLGGNTPAGLSQAAASALIEQLLARQQPTPRQMMILRFWNRMDLARLSKEEVAEWLEQFYNEEPRRKEAWELFKIDSGDDGSQHDPSSVPLGAGESYLNR